VSDFKVTNEVIKIVSKTFCISENTVINFHNIYQNVIADTMKRHYLAHVIRAMEEKLRDIPGNEMFRIICTPVAADSKNIGIAGSCYYKGRFFAIFYHPKTDEKQLRIMLAHELGHLFLVELVNSKTGSNYDEKTEIEPISTILGIFTILDKNEFYHNKTAPFKHNTADDVIKDFQLLSNRDQGILNIS
jgi:hypothetical protein